MTLAWDQSTDPTVSGYNVYYGTASRSYTNVVSAGSSTSATVSNLAAGVTYYFAATTYTLAGLESDYSAEASYQVSQANNPPTLDTPSDLMINQDSGLQVVPLTGISSGNPNVIQTLNVSAFSSNPGLIPNPTVTYANPDTVGTVSFSPTAGSYGTAIITVMVDNGGATSNTVIRTFAVIVNPIYNPPTIDLLSDVGVSENAIALTLNLTGITSGSTNGTPTLSVAAVSSNPGLIPNPAINYVSPATTGTLTFAPVTNAFGSARITITVSDNQPTNNSTSMSFGVTVNQAVPAPGLLTNAIIAPNSVFRFIVSPPAANSDKFKMSLASGAPAGAKLSTSRKGVNWVTWTPTLAQASTTNLIGISVTDVSNPALSTNQTLQVIVLDYLSVALGSTITQAGQSGTLPLALSSSDGVTNLSFAIAWPANLLPNPALSTSASGIASSSLRNRGTNVLITIQMSPGQVLQGSNVIGSLSFQSLPTQASSYINLPISSLSAVKPTAVPYSFEIPTAGQVTIINNLAMLQAAASATPTRNLTILGKVGNTYQVQYCTNFGAGSVWYPLGTYSQTNVSQTIAVDPTLSQVLYRVQQK